jgi:hypothetical protein
MKDTLKRCHPERRLIVAPKRDDQPQSKDHYSEWLAVVASGSSPEKLK